MRGPQLDAGPGNSVAFTYRANNGKVYQLYASDMLLPPDLKLTGYSLSEAPVRQGQELVWAISTTKAGKHYPKASSRETPSHSTIRNTVDRLFKCLNPLIS